MGHQFTRRRLYEMIWADPVKVVAARLGLSDVGLAKVCRAYDIPIPHRGYWTRLRAGRPVERRTLSPRPFGKRDQVQIGRMIPEDLRAAAAALEELALIPPVFEESVDAMMMRARQLVGVVRSSKNLENCHPAVAKAIEGAAVRQLERVEVSRATRWRRLPLNTAIEHRRLRILNGLFWALERCGAVPTIDRRNDRTISVLVGDVTVCCRLESPEVFSGRATPRSVPRTPAGPLRFMIVGWYGRPNSSRFWQDTSSRRNLEAMLSEITARILTSGEFRYRASLRDRYEQAVRRRATAQDVERRKQEDEERQKRAYLSKLAQDRVNDLLAMVGRWSQAREVRAFVQAVVAGGSEILVLPPPNSQQSWVRWALDLADQLDPLASK